MVHESVEKNLERIGVRFELRLNRILYGTNASRFDILMIFVRNGIYSTLTGVVVVVVVALFHDGIT